MVVIRDVTPVYVHTFNDLTVRFQFSIFEFACENIPTPESDFRDLRLLFVLSFLLCFSTCVRLYTLQCRA